MFGDADEVVSSDENTVVLKERYEKLGATFKKAPKAAAKGAQQDDLPL